MTANNRAGLPGLVNVGWAPAMGQAPLTDPPRGKGQPHLGKGHMGSALMGSLLFLCFLTEGLVGYSR